MVAGLTRLARLQFGKTVSASSKCCCLTFFFSYASQFCLPDYGFHFFVKNFSLFGFLEILLLFFFCIRNYWTWTIVNLLWSLFMCGTKWKKKHFCFIGNWWKFLLQLFKVSSLCLDSWKFYCFCLQNLSLQSFFYRV